MVTVVLDVVWAGHVTQSRHQGGEIGGWLGRPREERRVDILEDDLLQTLLLCYVGYKGVSEYFILQAFVVKLLNNLFNYGRDVNIKLEIYWYISNVKLSMKQTRDNLFNIILPKV